MLKEGQLEQLVKEASLADQRQADFLTVFGLISWMVLAIFFFRIAHSDEAKKASSR